MSNHKEFFKKFGESTQVKLELYRLYLREWLPVFFNSPNHRVRTINIYDFFAGKGKIVVGIVEVR